MKQKTRIEGIEVKHFTSFDGTRIAYQTVGQGPPIVFANGLGGTYDAWCYLFNHLKDRYRIITWDYRGLYTSDRPADVGTMTIKCMVRDMHRLIQTEGVERPIIAGWSMGVPVIFEYIKSYPQDVRALAGICGSAGRAFDTALNWEGSRYLMPPVFVLLEKMHGLTGVVMNRVLNWDLIYKLIQPVGMVAAEADIEVFREMVEDYSKLDFECYFRVMQDLGKHDAWDHLSSIDVPSLIVAAGKDFFTPVHVSERMHRRIRNSELFVLPKGTHYAPLEFPMELNQRMDAFLERVERIEPYERPKPKAKPKSKPKPKPKPKPKAKPKPKPKPKAKPKPKPKTKPKPKAKAKPKAKKAAKGKAAKSSRATTRLSVKSSKRLGGPAPARSKSGRPKPAKKKTLPKAK